MKNNKKKNIIKILKIQAWITGLFLVAYLLVLSFGESGVFLSDLNNKKRVAGAMVGAMIRIFGPPTQPVVSGNSFCDSNNLSVVRLDWVNVVDATSYDVFREGNSVADDITDNFLLDENLLNNFSYNYYVVASGPAGVANSEVINISTQGCEAPITYYVKIDDFEGRSMTSWAGTITTENQQPFFSGIASRADAWVELEIYGDNAFYAKTLTNQNGFWQWRFNSNLLVGNYLIYVKLLDLDGEIVLAQDSLNFEILAKDEDNSEKKKKKEQIDLTLSDFSSTKQPVVKKPFNLDISLSNDIYIRGVSVDREAYRGEGLGTSIDFSDVVVGGLPLKISYTLINEKNEIASHYNEEYILEKNLRVEKYIPLPLSLELGEYRLRIDASISGITVSDESTFILKDRPLLKIGATTYLTYHDLVGNLSWLFIGSTSFLSFFSIAAMREHYLYKRAVFHITEKVLKRRGFIN
ncbi:MAG: hypothetical protein WAV16_02670 [Candidatus Moraniibacteriota bacterium]